MRILLRYSYVYLIISFTFRKNLGDVFLCVNQQGLLVCKRLCTQLGVYKTIHFLIIYFKFPYHVLLCFAILDQFIIQFNFFFFFLNLFVILVLSATAAGDAVQRVLPISPRIVLGLVATEIS